MEGGGGGIRRCIETDEKTRLKRVGETWVCVRGETHSSVVVEVETTELGEGHCDSCGSFLVSDRVLFPPNLRRSQRRRLPPRRPAAAAPLPQQADVKKER